MTPAGRVTSNQGARRGGLVESDLDIRRPRSRADRRTIGNDRRGRVGVQGIGAPNSALGACHPVFCLDRWHVRHAIDI